jgi:hypothetical protein
MRASSTSTLQSVQVRTHLSPLGLSLDASDYIDSPWDLPYTSLPYRTRAGLGTRLCVMEPRIPSMTSSTILWFPYSSILSADHREQPPDLHTMLYPLRAIAICSIEVHFPRWPECSTGPPDGASSLQGHRTLETSRVLKHVCDYTSDDGPS